jgi:hypothetical protein
MRGCANSNTLRAILFATGMLLLGAQLTGALHVYDLDAHAGDTACELCVHYSSLGDGLPAAVMPLADHGAQAHAPLRASFYLSTPCASPHLIRGPPQFS